MNDDTQEPQDDEQENSSSSEAPALRKLHEVAEEDADKLIKMLVLAQNSDNENERTAALSKAKTFAIKKAIDLASIEMEGLGATKGNHGLSNEPFVSIKHRVAKGDCRRPPCHKFLSWLLVAHFRVDILTHGRYHASTITLIGRQSDVAFAIYAYGFLVETFNRMWRDYKQKTFASPDERNSYFYGLYQRLHLNLEKTTEDTLKQELAAFGEETAAQQKWDLMVVKEEELLEQATKDFHPKVKLVKGTDIGPITSRSAMYDGIVDGEKIVIARPLGEESAAKQAEKPSGALA